MFINKDKINILLSMGTRPEGIKLALVVKSLEKNKDKFSYTICSTGQHREMLKQVFDFFEIEPDFNLNLMTENQSLQSLSHKVLSKIGAVLDEVEPDIILVQGDTTTAFLSALSAFYKGVKIGHVEAGLRTYDKYNPFPEEINRQLISRIADLNFVPTKKAFDNLISENIDKENIFLTGNTIVDAINWGIKKIKRNINKIESKKPFSIINDKKKIILVTMHRRESFGEDIKEICYALKNIAERFDSIEIVYLVHLNPNVRVPVFKILKGIKNLLLIDPLDYGSFIWLMNKSYFIVTDSGGIQEEAPTLKKPVLVIRKKTERLESVEEGVSKLIDTNKESVIRSISDIIINESSYNKMISNNNPYGDGKAADRILKQIFNIFKSVGNN